MSFVRLYFQTPSAAQGLAKHQGALDFTFHVLLIYEDPQRQLIPGRPVEWMRWVAFGTPDLTAEESRRNLRGGCLQRANLTYSSSVPSVNNEGLFGGQASCA